MNSGVACSWPPGEKRTCNECIRRKGKCTIGGASVTQRAPRGTGLVCKKVCVVSQLTIEEEPEEEATGEAMVTGEVEAAGELAAEAVAEEDTTMRDAPEAAPRAEAGPSVDASRMLPMDTVKALLGIRSDGTI